MCTKYSPYNMCIMILLYFHRQILCIDREPCGVTGTPTRYKKRTYYSIADSCLVDLSPISKPYCCDVLRIYECVDVMDFFAFLDTR